jgi:hypothetical protein
MLIELRRLVITLIAFDAFQVYEVHRAGAQMVKFRLAFALAPVDPLHNYADYLAQYKSGGRQYMTSNATNIPVIAKLFTWIREVTKANHIIMYSLCCTISTETQFLGNPSKTHRTTTTPPLNEQTYEMG